MKRVAVLVAILLVSFSAGCASRQPSAQKVQQGMSVVRVGIIETAQIVETAHDVGMLSDDKYTAAKASVLEVTKRYNLVLRLSSEPSAEDVRMLLDDLSAIRDKIRGDDELR